MIFDIFSLDTFKLLVTVLRAGAAMNMSAATLSAVASNGLTSVAGAIDTSQAASGQIGVSFSAGALTVGNWDVQLRATIGGETQTVARAWVRVTQAASAA